MGNIEFTLNTGIDELGIAFPESPYFSPEATAYREEREKEVSTLIARVEGQIGGALTYSISPDTKSLKIGLVEVRGGYIGKGLGVQLLLEAERINIARIYGCHGYLNDANNVYSKQMFLRAGYRQLDALKFYK